MMEPWAPMRHTRIWPSPAQPAERPDHRGAGVVSANAFHANAFYAPCARSGLCAAWTERCPLADAPNCVNLLPCGFRRHLEEFVQGWGVAPVASEHIFHPLQSEQLL